MVWVLMTDVVASRPYANIPYGKGMGIPTNFQAKVPASDSDAVNMERAEPTLSRGQVKFYGSEECEAAREALAALVQSPDHDTDSIARQGGDLTFEERHMLYLSTHPHVNLTGYISNLRLMTRRK